MYKKNNISMHKTKYVETSSKHNENIIGSKSKRTQKFNDEIQIT